MLCPPWGISKLPAEATPGRAAQAMLSQGTCTRRYRYFKPEEVPPDVTSGSKSERCD